MGKSHNPLVNKDVIEMVVSDSAKNDTTNSYEAIIQHWDSMPADTKAALLAIARQFNRSPADATSSEPHPESDGGEFSYSLMTLSLVG